MTTITCKIPESLDAQLEALAEKQGISKSEIVRSSLEQTVKWQRKRKQLSMYDLMKDCCGIVEGGPRDYATNPKYMEDFGR